jgi:hypothetical protein
MWLSLFWPPGRHSVFALGWLCSAEKADSGTSGTTSAIAYFVRMLTQRRARKSMLDQLLLLIEQNCWQDVTLSAGNIFFCFTLVPMLRQRGRPPLLTCLPTGLALLAGGFVFATLHLWFTALTQMITGLQWLALAFKKSRQIGADLPSGSRRTERPILGRASASLPIKELRQSTLRNFTAIEGKYQS